VYVRVQDGSADTIFGSQWSLVNPENTIPSDDNPDVFREYTYLDGGVGGVNDPFDRFQLKIVFKSTNSSKVPVIKDLRVIAMAT